MSACAGWPLSLPDLDARDEASFVACAATCDSAFEAWERAGFVEGTPEHVAILRAQSWIAWLSWCHWQTYGRDVRERYNRMRTDLLTYAAALDTLRDAKGDAKAALMALAVEVEMLRAHVRGEQ